MPDEKSGFELIQFHEFRHAKDYFEGVDLGGGDVINSETDTMFQPETIQCAWELRGNEGVMMDTIRQQREGDYTWSFNNAVGDMMRYYDVVEGIEPQTPIERRVIGKLKKRYGRLLGK